MKTLTTIIGVMIGIIGFAYGSYKDFQLKNIQKRKNAPHFIPLVLQVDASSSTNGGAGSIKYNFSNKIKKMDERLFNMESFEKEIPDYYPDDRVVGIKLKNKGESLRFFKVDSKENILLIKDQYKKDTYDLRYIYRQSEKGEPLRFKIKYETSSGYRESQIWETKKGIKRLQKINLKPA